MTHSFEYLKQKLQPMAKRNLAKNACNRQAAATPDQCREQITTWQTSKFFVGWESIHKEKSNIFYLKSQFLIKKNISYVVI